MHAYLFCRYFEHPQCAKHCSRLWGLTHKTERTPYLWEAYIPVQLDIENLLYPAVKEASGSREIQLKLSLRSVQI